MRSMQLGTYNRMIENAARFYTGYIQVHKNGYWDDKMIDNITERHPMKKFLEPKDVANMTEFLLSEKSNSISGQIFEMDCGIVSFKI